MKLPTPPAHQDRQNSPTRRFPITAGPYSLLLWHRGRRLGSPHPLRNATMKLATPNTAATEEPRSTLASIPKIDAWIFWCSRTPVTRSRGTKKARCSQPTGSILDRLFFAVQYESFCAGRLTLDASLSAGKMVFRECRRNH